NKTDNSTSSKTTTTNKTDSSTTSNKTTTDNKTTSSSTTTNKVDSSTSNKTSADTKSDSTASDKEKTSNVIRVDNNNTSEKKDADKTTEKVDADKTSEKKDADKTTEKVDADKTEEKKDDKVTEEKVEPKVEEEVEAEVAPELAPTDSLKQFKIEYDLDGGINNPSNPSGYDKDEIFALFAPSKSGYKFMGWDEGSDDAGNKKFTAKWEVIDYPIEYVLDGGQNAPENPTSYTVDDRIELKDPTKLGYDFDGWVEGSVIDLGSTGEKKFTAQWKDAGKFSTPLLKLVNNSNMMSTISIALLGVMILGWLLLGLRGF
ncbi:MAG: InlB B-repeat-containing protein, partial [Erysipelotrichaceae bacterium]|nr:InlB B-repeat-containing protein [Erysipelotrichaceae bacterium]